jgi:hypothetical protein
MLATPVATRSARAVPPARPTSPPSTTRWRMGATVPSEVTWMNGVVAQFHKDYPPFTIPVMVFFLIVQRRMVNGLVAGAVKG